MFKCNTKSRRQQQKNNMTFQMSNKTNKDKLISWATVCHLVDCTRQCILKG